MLVDIKDLLKQYDQKIAKSKNFDENVDMTTIKNRLTRKTEDLFTEFGLTNIPNLLDLCYELLILEAEKN